MRSLCLVVLVLAACGGKKREVASEPPFSASCDPSSTLDSIECKLTNKSAAKGRACVTARVWVPDKQPLVAQRLCAEVEAGATKVLMPRFDRIETLQPLCSPDGKWICRSEVAETPAQLTENIAQPKS